MSMRTCSACVYAICRPCLQPLSYWRLQLLPLTLDWHLPCELKVQPFDEAEQLRRVLQTIEQRIVHCTRGAGASGAL